MVFCINGIRLGARADGDLGRWTGMSQAKRYVGSKARNHLHATAVLAISSADENVCERRQCVL